MSKEERILSAAREVFARYGYARTTMGDVAQTAGISRPALYLVFPGKEELFSAVLHQMNAEALRDIKAGLADCGSLEEKLNLALERWIARPYDVAYAYPDARDFFSYAFPAMQEVAAEFQAFLADLLREPVCASGMKAAAEDMAQALLFSAHGFKVVAADGTDLRRMIALQVHVFAAALREQSGKE